MEEIEIGAARKLFRRPTQGFGPGFVDPDKLSLQVGHAQHLVAELKKIEHDSAAAKFL